MHVCMYACNCVDCNLRDVVLYDSIDVELHIIHAVSFCLRACTISDRIFGTMAVYFRSLLRRAHGAGGLVFCCSASTALVGMQVEKVDIPRNPPSFMLPSKPDDCIFFCGHREGPYRQFSNWFAENTLPTKGHWSPLGRWSWCAEQSFIIAKAEFFGAKDTVDKLAVITPSDDPVVAKKHAAEMKNLGRTGIPLFDAVAWDAVCFEAMTKVLLCKFGQSDELQQQLIDTGDLFIVEAAHYDSKWGIGLRHLDTKTGRGAVAVDGSWNIPPKSWPSNGNLLGRSLMVTRSILQHKVHLCKYMELAQ